MQASVVIKEKPIQHIGLADWYATQWALQQTNNTRRNDAFLLRHEARQLRNESSISTSWNTYHNNARLADRITELQRWKDTLQTCLDRVEREMALLKNEKFNTEREFDALQIPFNVVSECLSMRDSRQGTELTYDEGDSELKTELCVLEGVKKLLVERCQAAWEKLNRLGEVKFKLSLDINDKEETLEIDKDQLTLDKNCAGISYKIDPLRIPTNYNTLNPQQLSFSTDPTSSIPYETWLEHARYTKLLADNELADTYKMREALFVMRERARNDMRAQSDRVDFTLRKRIYETQRARNELEWQLKKMTEEMDKVLKEITTLERALLDMIDGGKLCATRLENRSYRPGIELARDEPEIGLKEEVLQLRQTHKDLQDKINCAKATYNALEDQKVIIDRDLQNKTHALMTDIRCLDLRVRLRTGVFSKPSNETDRNIELTRMEKEIPPEA